MPLNHSPTDDGDFDLTLHGVKSHVVAVIEGHELYLRTRNGRFDLHWVDPFGGDDEEQVGEDKIVAPLPGTVVALLAEEGAALEKGAPILTLEVMKMEQTLRAPFAGVLKQIKCKVGDIVQEGVELAEVEPDRIREISMSDPVRIVEVGPRDGLQNEKTPVSVAARIAFIKALVGAGLHTVEVGAFVSPKAIPQMVNSDQVLRGVDHHPDSEFHVLVPNEKGYEAARAAGAKVIAVFASASEGFSRANINCSVAESIERFRPVVVRAGADGIKVRGYISCVLGCPYDGEVRPQAVVDVAKKLWDLGCYEISLGDTIGVGTPVKARQLLRAVAGAVPIANLAMHFHDTYGQALANLYCGDGGGRTGHRFRRRRSRRLPVCTGGNRQCRDGGRRLHAGGHGDRDRGRYAEIGGCHQRGQPSDRPPTGEPRRLGDECEAGGEVNSSLTRRVQRRLEIFMVNINVRRPVPSRDRADTSKCPAARTARRQPPSSEVQMAACPRSLR